MKVHGVKRPARVKLVPCPQVARPLGSPSENDLWVDAYYVPMIVRVGDPDSVCSADFVYTM